MTFEEIYARQEAFNRRFFADRGLGSPEDFSSRDRVEWTKQFVLHVEGELHELLGETSWKMHRPLREEVVRSNVLEEWVDCLKFLLGLANVWGFSAGELEAEFLRKTAVVEHRYGMEQRLRAISPTDRIVAVDVDGVLSDYPDVFVEWAVHNTPELEGRGDLPFLSTLKAELGARRYLELKDEYRESGAKRSLRVREGAKALLDGLRAAGFAVVLLSARPYWRFSRIYADTLEWLEANGLRHDAILFDPEKHRRIVRDFPGILALVEDDPIVAAEVSSAGGILPVVLVENQLNRGLEVPGAFRASGPAEALKILGEILKF